MYECAVSNVITDVWNFVSNSRSAVIVMDRWLNPHGGTSSLGKLTSWKMRTDSSEFFNFYKLILMQYIYTNVNILNIHSLCCAKLHVYYRTRFSSRIESCRVLNLHFKVYLKTRNKARNHKVNLTWNCPSSFYEMLFSTHFNSVM